MHGRVADARGTGWETILAEPASLAEVVIFGSGKYSDLKISLMDGRHFVMAVGHVVLSADSAVTAQFDTVDDLNVKIRYSGPGLDVRSARIRCNDPACAEEFGKRVREWLSGDREDEYGENNELGWCVDAEIVLSSRDDHDAAATGPIPVAPK